MRQDSPFRTRHMSSSVVTHGELVKLSTAHDESERIAILAKIILNEFDHYFFSSRYMPNLAKQAFEQRDWGWSLELSQNRIAIYSLTIAKLAPQLAKSYPDIIDNDDIWRRLEDAYYRKIADRYEADLALAFLHSVRRKILQDLWRRVEYSFGEAESVGVGRSRKVTVTFPGCAEVSSGLAGEVLKVADLATNFRDFAGDAIRVADRLNHVLGLDGFTGAAIRRIEMVDSGFFRNRGAYLIGRIELEDDSFLPLAIALLNEKGGIFVDAVLVTTPEIHNLFSSTLANFHVTCPHYHELSRFLHTLTPKRPLGLTYSTIGFNHVGKVAVIHELEDQLKASGERLGEAVGFPGTVAIGFSAPGSAYVLKVIRNKPTANYKWGTFDGVDTVLAKYRVVHEINRTGSMLDNIIYTNLALDRDWFADGLIEELLTEASDAVSLSGAHVLFKYLIVQRKMVPLPVFLETACREDARAAVINLGVCIKNNAATNVFNKDLDGRNYGVNPYQKVFLFDYDALERLTDIKIRTNLDRFDGEEDVPDWVFEEGYVFLPEEIEAGLRIHDRSLRRLFRRVHSDLFTTAYWQGLQNDLRAGKVPHVSTYPDDKRLIRSNTKGR